MSDIVRPVRPIIRFLELGNVTELREWAALLESRSFAHLDGEKARTAADTIESLRESVRILKRNLREQTMQTNGTP